MDYDDFDRYLAKNTRMARGYEIADNLKKDKGDAQVATVTIRKTCFNCKSRNSCNDFRIKRTGGTGGSVSIGDDSDFVCVKWQPFEVHAKQKPLTQRQVNNMMKNALKGRL